MKSQRPTPHLHKSIVSKAVRNGLTLAIPFLIMGSFSLLLNNFPFGPYQVFLSTDIGNVVSELLITLYNISLGSLALILILTISLSFGRLSDPENVVFYLSTALCSYLAFCGGMQKQKDYIFGAEWVFSSMCITVLSCIMLRYTSRARKTLKKLHTMGAEYHFNQTMQHMPSIILIVSFFTVSGYLLRVVGGSTNVTNFGSYLFLQIFDGLSGNILGVLLYVISAHFLWFFGIHGTNTLEAVSQRLFEQNIDINQALLTVGETPTEIFSKTFLDTFVFLGGCGCALSFVIALCFVSKRKHNRKLAHFSLPSVLFNISEISVFGFPIIFNSTMIVPFILAPVVLTLTSTLATVSGMVPAVAQSVEWTVPIILSGYKATNSFSGSILQVANVVIGVLIYIPFIRRSEHLQTEQFKREVHQIETDMILGEKDGNIPLFLRHDYRYNHCAKTLAMDLENAILRNQLEMYYQPQISSTGALHGIEALLRWKHPVVGFVAPPVIISLASEGGFLDELSTCLLNCVSRDAHILSQKLKEEVYLSVNLSPNQMQCNGFFSEVCDIFSKNDWGTIRPVLEITERVAMEISEQIKQDIIDMKKREIQFSLDDFGMGHNSVIQLQEGLFDEVKLDGKLVSNILTKDRSRDIISSIIQMSHTLDCRVVAEFVETAEQRDVLKSLGCNIYQGFYYSPALELDDFITFIESGIERS